MITLAHDSIKRLSERLGRVTDSIAHAMSGGINEAAEAHVELTTESVNNMIAIDRLKFNEAFHIDPATETRPQCTIKVDARYSVNLEAFEAKQTPEGVEVTVYRYGPPLLYLDAFGPDRPRLGKGIYHRISKARFPIKKIKELKLVQEKRVAEVIKQNEKAIPHDAVLAIRDRLGNAIQGESL